MKLFKDLRAHGLNDKKDGMFHTMQNKLIDSIPMENPKDKTLFRVIKIICDHNMLFNKVRHKRHMELLAEIQPASHEKIVDKMLQLSIIIEQKRSAELKGKKGIFRHDGWNRRGTHFVALMAFYVIYWDVEEDGNKIEKLEINFISFPTLLHNYEADDEDVDTYYA